MAILMISRRGGGHIGIMFLILIGGLGPLSPLVTPMVIESKCMPLSQIQKELVYGYFNDFTKRRRPYWNYVFEIDRGPGSPITSGYAHGHRVKMYASITNTEGVMVLLMIP